MSDPNSNYVLQRPPEEQKHALLDQKGAAEENHRSLQEGLGLLGLRGNERRGQEMRAAEDLAREVSELQKEQRDALGQVGRIRARHPKQQGDGRDD